MFCTGGTREKILLGIFVNRSNIVLVESFAVEGYNVFTLRKIFSNERNKNNTIKKIHRFVFLLHLNNANYGNR